VKRRLLVRAAGAGVIATVATKSSLAAPQVSGLLGGQSLAALSKLFFGSMVVTLAGASAVVAVTRGLPSPSKNPASAGAALSARVSERAPRVATGGVPRETASESAAPQPASEPLPEGAPRSASRAVPLGTSPLEPPAAAAPLPGTRLEAELSLLREVRNATAAGHFERARRQLERLDLEHPGGVLLEERVALRALTECAISGGGAQLANDFLRDYPRSVYVAKVRHACRVAGGTDRGGAGH
jgi:hypothetical protein